MNPEKLDVQPSTLAIYYYDHLHHSLSQIFLDLGSFVSIAFKFLLLLAARAPSIFFCFVTMHMLDEEEYRTDFPRSVLASLFRYTHVQSVLIITPYSTWHY